MRTFDRHWGFGRYPGTSLPAPAPAARRLTVSGFVCAAVGILVLPIVLGPLGLGLGVAGAIKGDSLGRWAAVAGAAALCLGTLLGTLVLSAH
jgi:hypothetical protein